MATVSIRSNVKTWLTSGLDSALSEALVLRSWDGKVLERSTIWVIRVTGETTFPFSMAGRKTRDDEFTVRLAFAALVPGDSEVEAEARVESYVDALENLIAADPSMGGLDGVMAATYSLVEGPDTYPADEGFGAMSVVDVTVQSRLS